MNKKILGQFFTRKDIVDKMCSMIENTGRVLEPSCGDGRFLSVIKNCTAIEIDSNICPLDAINVDFFSYSMDEKFDTIIGNPPYVKYQDIFETTKSLLGDYYIDARSNLYLSFMIKCIDHLTDNGELIFIVPRDFIKSTGAKKLNKRLFNEGSFTHFEETGDEMMFDDANVNSVIFRWVKGRIDKTLYDGRVFNEHNGMISFSNDLGELFSELFFIKVGSVSGMDSVFESVIGTEFVCSKTKKTGELRKLIYQQPHTDLEPYRDILAKRAGKSDLTWWKWTRNGYISNEKRVYVNTKIRDDKPFFSHPCRMFDGSVLGIFYNFDMDEQEVADKLNSIDWNKLGFKCGQRYLFTQYSLENSIIPKIFNV